MVRLTRPDARERMPVVRSRDGHGIDVLRREHLAEIRVGREVRIRPDALVVDRLGPLEDRGVDIAERRHAHAFDLLEAAEVVAAAAVEADDGDADVAVGAGGPGPRTGGKGGGGERGGAEEGAAVDGVHG